MKKDAIKTAWERNRQVAILYAKEMADTMMENYHEPTRSSTPKGNLIGFSHKKKRAAILMMLYNPPFGLGLKEIAEIAGVPPGVLRVWRTQVGFQRAESEECDAIGKVFLNMLDAQLLKEEIQSVKDTRLKDGPNVFRLTWAKGKRVLKVLKSERGTPLLENFISSHASKMEFKVVDLDDSREGAKEPDLKNNKYTTIDIYLRLLPFFNPIVTKPFIELISEKVDTSILWLKPLLIKSAEVRDDKSFRKWKQRPEVKAVTRITIENLIESISDSEARKELGPEGIQEAVECLKTFVLWELDL